MSLEKAALAALFVASIGSSCSAQPDLGPPGAVVARSSAEVQAALSSAGRNGGGIVWLPGRAYTAAGGWSVPAGVTMKCSGSASTKLTSSSPDADIVTLAGPGAAIEDCGFSSPIRRAGGADIAVRANDTAVRRISVVNPFVAVAVPGFDRVVIVDLDVQGGCSGVDLSGIEITLERANIRGFGGAGCYGVRVGALTRAAHSVDDRLIDVETAADANHKPDEGILVQDAGGLFMSRCSNLFATVGTKFLPGPGQLIQWATLDDDYLGDAGNTYDFVIDTAAPDAEVQGVQCTACWTSSSSRSGVIVGDTGGGSVFGIHFVGLRAMVNGADGILVIARRHPADVTIDDSQICGFRGTGVHLGAGVTGVSVRASRIGSCDGATTPFAANLAFDGGNDAVTVTGNDFGGVRAPALRGQVGPRSLVANNRGLQSAP
ncbi:MAG TPA: hypothetical protein VGS12_09980 [Caulobacteraceae bacterium]|nr:hypothetical protein [Caulobacteraceae bacterium]